MNQARTLFSLFFISGFCGLLYQIVWIRLAFADFGIITPVLSVVISVFMLGLSLGSWAGGRYIGTLTEKSGYSAAFFYAGAEILIALGSVTVPPAFAWFGDLLLHTGESDSFQYLFYSALSITVALFPWVFAMGTTFPFMMAFIKEAKSEESSGFSFLYLANVTGSAFGVLVTALFLIELLGFTNSLYVAGFLNILIASVSVRLGIKSNKVYRQPEHAPAAPAAGIQRTFPEKGLRNYAVLLFLTGFVSIAMEVVWTRAFTPVLKTTIYSFAGLLATYLFTTFLGTAIYRKHLKNGSVASLTLLLALTAIVLPMPLLLNDPSRDPGVISVLISISPFCAILGYMTPKLIDAYSSGNPSDAGYAYAINILGSITGPLVAGYLLLPAFGVKNSLLLLSTPFYIVLVLRMAGNWSNPWYAMAAVPAAALALFAGTTVKTFEAGDIFTSKEVRRDYAATVISTGEDMGKRLLVNGIGITFLTPLTKLMAHFPMAVHGNAGHSLVICFGMGTTFRSIASWGGDTTAVELIPGVRDAFGYYFDDTGQILKNPKNRIIIDDGRRFLKRTHEKYDVITIDPPPPIEAAGSSLLYSGEFYDLLKKRLNKGGIVLQWFPGGDDDVFRAVSRTVRDSFPYVKLFFPNYWESIIGKMYLLSMEPINIPATEEFVKRMPVAARQDFMEWWDYGTIEEHIRRLLFSEVNIESFLSPDKTWLISDDRPVNEYFLVRKNLAKFWSLSFERFKKFFPESWFNA